LIATIHTWVPGNGAQKGRIEMDWIVRDNFGEWPYPIKAATAIEALAEARENVNYEDYTDGNATIWVDIHVSCEETGEEDEETIILNPPEPECFSGEEHDWQAPYSVLGGVEENPGVWGHGGGVVIRRVCANCGLYKIIDTWAQNPNTGEQGLRSVRYEPPDEISLQWVENN